MSYLVELIGILAGLFVLLSFTVTGERKIRMINIVGCVLFVIYGINIGALSIWLINGILVFVQLGYLLKGNKPKETSVE